MWPCEGLRGWLQGVGTCLTSWGILGSYGATRRTSTVGANATTHEEEARRAGATTTRRRSEASRSAGRRGAAYLLMILLEGRRDPRLHLALDEDPAGVVLEASLPIGGN